MHNSAHRYCVLSIPLAVSMYKAKSATGILRNASPRLRRWIAASQIPSRIRRIRGETFGIGFVRRIGRQACGVRCVKRDGGWFQLDGEELDEKEGL